MSRPLKNRIPVPPRAYTLDNTPLPFSKGTYYRWEKRGIIPPLLRVGSKTLISADTIEAILAGRIVLPKNAGMLKPPTPRDRGGHIKRGRAKRPKPETSVAAE
jgi:hypothetical protein